jgi:hypothetical protein
LSEVVSGNGQYTQELKVQAANYLLPYKHSKCGTTPVPRYVAEPVQLPHLTPVTLEQINANINYITELKAQGSLDIDIADSFINGQRTIANNLIADLIEGGLPHLPGTDIIMPELNGHTLDLEKNSEATAIEAPAPEPPAQDPEP